MLRYLKKTFKMLLKGVGCLFMVLGFAVMVAAVIAYCGITALMNERLPVTGAQALPDKFALTFDTADIYDDAEYQDFFNPFMLTFAGCSASDALYALDKAKDDARITGLYARISTAWLGMTDTGNIRQKIAAFGQGDKPTASYSETIGLDGMGTSEYYLASAFKQVWVQPTGSVNFVGLAIATPFFKTLLDKIGIGTDFYARYEYKGAIESATLSEMSKPVKENMTELLDGIYDKIINDIAVARKLTPEQLRTITDNAPYEAEQALKVGLIDKTAYMEEFKDSIGDVKQVDLVSYINALKAEKVFGAVNNKQDTKDKVAVINIGGMIVSGSAEDTPFASNGYISAADDIIAALEQAADDDKVKAIILKVNSGGGSYTASDAVWHAVQVIKTDKKLPVVALLGDTAASGAYFIAIGADKIVASPFTVTGSIGVFGGKPYAKELLKKIGVNIQEITKGKNAAMMSIAQPFTPLQKQKFEQSLDTVYKDFTAKVAAARGLDEKQTEAVARGKVFSGIKAKEVGLIDELGDFDTALKLISDMAQIPVSDLQAEVYPKPLTGFEMFEKMFGGGFPFPLASVRNTVRSLDIISRNSVLYIPEYQIK